MGIGDLEGAEATITQSYDTAVALAKRELSPVTGFMMGKIKVAGNMGLLLGLQGVLGQIAESMSAMDVEY
jgi:putative sterol carrier protein